MERAHDPVLANVKSSQEFPTIGKVAFFSAVEHSWWNLSERKVNTQMTRDKFSMTLFEHLNPNFLEARPDPRLLIM